jgi:hypothetical protein
VLRAAWILTLAVAGTGVFILLAGVLWPGYFSILWLHQVLGWGLVAGLPALLLHLRGTKSNVVLPILGLTTVAVCAVPAISGVDAPDATGLGEFLVDVFSKVLRGDGVLTQHVVSPSALFALAILTMGTGVAGLLAPVQGRRSARWSGLCLTILLGWATMTGAAQPWIHRDTLFLAISAHSATGGAAVVGLALHVLSSRLWKREAPDGRARAQLGLALLVLGGGMYAVHRAETVAAHRDRGDAAGVQMARIPGNAEERRQAVEGSWFHMDQDVLRDSSSCGDAGCHADITDEWGGSAHRFAASNGLYRAAVDGLVAERGLADAVFCAGCHDPERVLTGRMNEYSDGVPDGGSDGVSCLVCHGMIEAEGDPPSNGAFTVAAAVPAYPGEGEAMHKHLLRDPRRHDQLLGVNRFVISPTPCKACHRLELGADHGRTPPLVLQNQVLDPWEPGADVVVCEECHLDVASRSFDQYRHEMVGINSDLALYGGAAAQADSERVARVAEHARRQAGAVAWMPIEEDEWPRDAPEPPDQSRPGEDVVRRALGMTLEGRREGDVVHLETSLINQRIGHSFPSGPFDLQQVWLELRVSVGDDVILHRGRALEDGRVIDPAARLGARELGADGEPLREHRLFELSAVEDKRVLELGGRADDAFDVVVPEGTEGPVTVRARWLFRRANPEFTRWALGEESSPLPIWEIASARAELP